jgi:hypothetical protein
VHFFTLKMMLKQSLRSTIHVAQKGFKIAFMLHKLAVIISFGIIHENFFFCQNHCEIQVGTLLVCALFSIKYDKIWYIFSQFSF